MTTAKGDGFIYQRAQYLKQYPVAIQRVYPALDGGSVLLPFPQLFTVLTR